jgi:energy-coupling factor transporter ATP-binding protein EcfA2
MSDNYLLPPKYVIGLTGYAGCGKTTIAKMLTSLLAKEDAVLLSFAAPIKAMLYAGLGMQDKDLSAELIYGKTYRELAQTLGTEWGRDMVRKDIWLQALAMKAEDKFVIIDDVRFEQEADFVRAHGELIHVRRLNHRSISESGHASEKGVSIGCLDRIFTHKGNSLVEVKEAVGEIVNILRPNIDKPKALTGGYIYSRRAD